MSLDPDVVRAASGDRVHGRAVATAGCSVAGASRAPLAARLAAGRAQGCRLAIVEGRVETSAPVLPRAGFEVVGSERSSVLDAG